MPSYRLTPCDRVAACTDSISTATGVFNQLTTIDLLSPDYYFGTVTCATA